MKKFLALMMAMMMAFGAAACGGYMDDAELAEEEYAFLSSGKPHQAREYIQKVQNGLPVSRKENHGYGCYGIRAIAQRHQGICTFEAENNVFTLRVILLVRDVKENL